MKVLVAIIFAISSVSALGSGPYLPSGWRPQGPSFYLPSEVTKPSDSPLRENVFQETEASGSDALREYGPPKLDEIVTIVTNQGLPDVATEQTFFVETKVNQELVSAVEKDVAVEATTEQIAAIISEATTEAQLAEIAVEEQTAEILTEVQPTFETKAEIVETSTVEETTEFVQLEEVVVPTALAIKEEIVTATAVAQEENPTAAVPDVAVPIDVVQQEVVLPSGLVPEVVVPTVVEQVVVETVSKGVNNIAEALVNLEKEVKAAEALESAVEIKQEFSGSLEQAPEGFLEYGPPGFREYGPPKEEILRSATVELAPSSAFENNEVRRRRFSPKFRSTKKH